MPVQTHLRYAVTDNSDSQLKFNIYKTDEFVVDYTEEEKNLKILKCLTHLQLSSTEALYNLIPPSAPK